MKKPLVSIIIPCYNYAAYVKEAIESAVNQTHDNTEIIVINDGSTDDSDSAIKRLQKKYEFRYINKANEGIVATRNLGISLARGEYQMQLDADDYLDVRYVEKCLTTAASTGADIVYTQVQIFGRDNFVSEFIDYDREKLKHDNYIHASALIKTSSIRGRQYDQYLNDKGYEDWDLFLGMCMDGALAVLVDEPLLHYRKHVSQSSRSDVFGGTKKEILVRHHIWSKQNARHPKEFWYFSSQIDLLLNMIHAYEEFTKKEQEFQERLADLTALNRDLKNSRLTNIIRRMLK